MKSTLILETTTVPSFRRRLRKAWLRAFRRLAPAPVTDVPEFLRRDVGLPASRPTAPPRWIRLL
ncbi:MAG: hypothetical protein AAF914_05240 [Pseudomonadota bacterium]